MGNVQTAASAHEVLWRQAPSGELVDLGRPHRSPLGQLRLQRTPKGVLRRREAILLGVVALLLHGAVIFWVSQKPTPVLPIVPPEIPPMTIEFAAPAPPVIEPPPPAPAPVVPAAAGLPAPAAAGNTVQPVIVQAPMAALADKPEPPDAFFGRRQKAQILEYYEENRGPGECPRGMVKRGDKCESRIKERDWKLRQPLASSEKPEDLPTPLLLKLGPPAPDHQFKRVGFDILMLKGPQNIVTDAVLDLGAWRVLGRA